MMRYGNLPVPWAVAWSAEDAFYVGEYGGVPAICQKSAQGEGVPNFGTPHADRQRILHIEELCDVCAKPLRLKSKFSLSSFGSDPRPGTPLTQVEPLLCRDCAMASIRYCPSLQAQKEGRRLRLRQVFRSSGRLLEATPQQRADYAPGHKGFLVGQAVTDITAWKPIEVA